ncbi:hypothetical protein JTE90_003415 [Oedothorax gibbosus]|uniref:Uncharacterized protein n=1 Tax=Oedothorax gibbosus TaxID=931172 RepID=A0AAV6TZ66_9ARAC|nr:hypothetical protein JTE90_003415 [Oedothorax gibbosus]
MTMNKATQIPEVFDIEDDSYTILRSLLTAKTLMDIPATVPIDIPATVPIDIPATVPIDIPATVPMDIPATVPMDIPATVPIDIPATVPTSDVKLLTELMDIPATEQMDMPANEPTSDVELTELMVESQLESNFPRLELLNLIMALQIKLKKLRLPTQLIMLHFYIQRIGCLMLNIVSKLWTLRSYILQTNI